MTITTLHDQLLKQVDQLSAEDQHRVLEFASTLLKTNPPKNRPKHFLELFGTLDSQSAEEMKQAIEEGCERIDPNDW
jgi:hypothetical protein